ncbi:S1/P1 nuclease [Patiriisocius marinus]|nr:S1/P1 nuclease [Patiriisocius marinus]
MKSILLFACCVILSLNMVNASEDWGKTGHRTVGQISENHMTKKALKNVKELLGGESLAFVSTYGDEIRSDDQYRKYAPWHYVSFPFGSTYEETEKSEKGDIIQGINTCISVLKDERSSTADKAFYLRMLIHFIGDLHMPLHVGLAEDKGGNDFQVLWFGKGTNLHTVWDTKMLEDYNMSYTELADNADVISKKEIAELQNSTVADWMYESRALCEKIYDTTSIGEKLGYRYSYQYVNVARSQLQKAGIRLAGVLNEIFG